MYTLFTKIKKIKKTIQNRQRGTGAVLDSMSLAPQLLSKLPWQTSDGLRSLTSSYRILPAFPQSLIFPFSDG